ncbi:hypothetical protein D3C73_1598180 [compost metagenome]
MDRACIPRLCVVLDAAPDSQVTSEPAQAAEDPPLKQCDAGDDQAGDGKAVGRARPGNPAHVDAE